MMPVRRHLLQLMVAALGAAATPHLACAQAYPTRPITMVVPFGPGGPTDVLARVLAERMKVSLGEAVMIENAGGAGGSTGVGRVARAAGDGYTLSIGPWTSHVVNGAIYTLSYDLLNDFEPVALLASAPVTVVARNTMPAVDLKDLLTQLKTSPDKMSAATAGAGTPPHIAGIYFQNVSGTSFRFVPYRSGGQAMQDLIGAQTDLMFTEASNSLQHVRDGKIKAYAVAAKSRLAAAPDIPTTGEAGLPGYLMSGWYGLWVPKATPRPIIDKLNAAVVDALADPAVRARLAALEIEIPPREQQTPEVLGAHQRAEIEKWWPILKAANIKAE